MTGRTQDAAAGADCAVDLWHFALPDSVIAADLALLEPEERARAGRFVQERDRARWVSARAGLRRILAARLHCAPGQLRFATSAHGRPSVPGAGFDFNLSHSGAFALLGLCADGPIGVDVEALRAVSDREHLARRVFTPAEAAAIEALAPPLRDPAFLSCWTRKEACLKALGMGLSLATTAFEVGLGGVTVVTMPAPHAMRLIVNEVPIGPQAVASVATAVTAGWRLHRLDADSAVPAKTDAPSPVFVTHL